MRIKIRHPGKRMSYFSKAYYLIKALGAFGWYIPVGV